MSRRTLYRTLSPLLFAALFAVAGCSETSGFRYPGQQFFESEPKTKSSTRSRAITPATGGDEAGEGGEGWYKTGASEAQVLADSDSCYSYANAQVAKDIRIDQDINAARGVRNSFFEQSGSLDRRVDAFYYDNARVRRFEGCMRSRGYIRN